MNEKILRKKQSEKKKQIGGISIFLIQNAKSSNVYLSKVSDLNGISFRHPDYKQCTQGSDNQVAVHNLSCLVEAIAGPGFKNIDLLAINFA
jgi:hypothetical protein